ncbi:hypothetical protein BH18ACT7_BH18ACT7_22810 [soil metagenome]
MLETGVRQVRMAFSMVFARRIDTRNVARLVEDALATLREFGSPGTDVQQLIDGPFSEPAERLEFALRSLRRTARRLDAQSPFYARRFAAASIRPDKLDIEALRTIPVTAKRDLIDRQVEFRCADVAPHLTTRTTGTTGRPAEIWLSRYELELWSGLGSLASLLRGEFLPSDVLQVNVSSRATASVQLNLAVCRMIGAGCRLVGIVPPDEALDSLAQGGATLLATCPSYLGELVVAARRRGMGPTDFTLRRIDAGGEVLSASLARAARDTFGVDSVNDPYEMTAVIPVTARRCSQEHLHHDINQGYVEVLDLQTSEPAQPGALGTLVVTPYFPYRDCMPVFRYDTRDVVRCLPEAPLTCEMAGIPATSLVLGKADGMLRLATGDVVSPRQLVEAVESLPSDPWPARFRAAAPEGHLHVTLPDGAVHPDGRAATVEHFAAHGLDVDLDIVGDEQARSLRHLRSDLHETTFVGLPTSVGG